MKGSIMYSRYYQHTHMSIHIVRPPLPQIADHHLHVQPLPPNYTTWFMEHLVRSARKSFLQESMLLLS